MESTAELIIHHYKALTRMDQGAIDRASDTLIQLQQNLQAFEVFLSMHQYTNDQSVINRALVDVNRMYKNLYQEIQPEHIHLLLEHVSVLILGNYGGQVFHSCMTLISAVFDRENFEEYKGSLLNLGRELIGEKPVEGMELWSLYVQKFQEEELEEYFPQIKEIIQASIESPLQEVRLVTLNCINEIVLYGLCEYLFGNNMGLMDSIMRVTQNAFENDGEPYKECEECVDIIELLMTDYLEMFEDYTRGVIRIANGVIRNEEQEPSRRLIMMRIYKGFAQMSIDVIKSMLETLIRVMIGCLIKLCKENKEDFKTYNTEEFIEILFKESQTREVFIKFLFEYIRRMIEEGEIEGLRVGLFCLEQGIEEGEEFLVERKETINEMLLASLKSDDMYLVDDVYTFIEMVIEKGIPLFDESIDAYMGEMVGMLDHPKTLKMIGIMINGSEELPSDIEGIMGVISKVNNKEQAEELFGCVGAIVSKQDEGCSGLYLEIRKMLLAYVSMTCEYNGVFYCFVDCIRIAPKELAEDIPSIVDLMNKSFNEEDYEIMKEYCVVNERLVDEFPISMRGYVVDVWDRMNEYVKKRMERLEVLSDTDMDVIGIFIRAMGKIYVLYGEVMNERMDEVLGYLYGIVMSNNQSRKAMGVFEMMEEMGDRMRVWNGFGERMLEIMGESEDEYPMRGFTKVMECCGESFTEREKEEISEFYLGIVEKGGGCGGGSEEEECMFRSVEVYLRSRIFEELRDKERMVRLLRDGLGGRNGVRVGHFILLLIRVSEVLKDEGLCLEMEELIYRGIKRKQSQKVYNLYFLGLTYMVNGFRGLIRKDRLEEYVEIGIKIAESATYEELRKTISLFVLIVWSDEIGVEIDERVLEGASGMMPPEDEDVILFGRIMKKVIEELMKEGQLECVMRVMMSEEYLVREMGDEVLGYCGRVLSEASEEDIGRVIGGSEKRRMRIERLMSSG